MLPNRSTNVCDDARPVVQRLREDAGLLGQRRPWRPAMPAPVNRSRRSSILLAGLSRSSSAAPPTSAATPTNANIAINSGLNA